MTDPTETIRRTMVQQINTDAGDRQRLEQQHGQVWNTTELQQDFDVLSFAAPLIAVREKSTGRMGSLFFQHSPRFYWGFQPDCSWSGHQPEPRCRWSRSAAKRKTRKLSMIPGQA